MTTELRCEGNLFGVISDDGKSIEVKCKRRACGHIADTVVFHTFNLQTGELISTQRFKQPLSRKE